MNDPHALLSLPVWEEWPTGELATTWFAGEQTEASLATWAATVGGFLGCGFRLRAPSGAGTEAPLGFLRAQAQRVADSFGTQLDQAAWDSAAAVTAPIEIQGGWEYRLGKSFGSPWTRITTGGRTHEAARVASAVRLPWAYGSDVPTSGLPLISQLEARRADQFLRDGPASVGLWFNHRDELCTSTSGPVLVQSDSGAWIHPDDTSGFVDSWAFSELSSRLGARPEVIDSEALARARAMCAVSDLANLTVIEQVGPASSGSTVDAADVLVALRRDLLPSLG